MRNTKIRPMLVLDQSNKNHSDDHQSRHPITTDNDHAWQRRVVEINSMQEDDDHHGGRINRGAREYWHARRVFLGSYHFSEEKGFKVKLRRSVRELNEAAMGVIVDIRREVSKRRAGIRVFKVRLVLPTLVLIVRCFTPWLKKVEQ